MVNAQTWLNGKFPNQEAKIKVNTLIIYSSNGTDKISGNTYSFHNAQLEGELDLSNFINLNYCTIGTANNTIYHKLNLLKLVNCDKLINLCLKYNDGQLFVKGNSAPNNQFQLFYCQNLSNFQFSDQFANTKMLYIQYCHQLSTISKLDRLINLNMLDIHYNPKLTNLDGLSGLEKLQTFTLSHCSEFERLTGLDKLVFLQNLTIHTCSKFDLDKLDIPAGVTSINISNLNFTSFRRNLGNNLTDLTVSNCSNLKEITDLDMSRLTRLNVSDCSNLEKISGLEYAADLYNINCQNCPKLKPFMHFGDWAEEIREIRRLSSLIFPNSTFNFDNLKEEIKRLKINDSTPLFQNKNRDLKEFITNAKNKLSEEAQGLPEVFLELQMELAKDIDDNFLQKQLENIKQCLNKKLSEQEINSLTDKQTEVIKLKKQLEDLQGQEL